MEVMSTQAAKSILDIPALKERFHDVRVADIIGQLYTEGLVPESLKNDVNAASAPSKKRKLIYKHLCSLNVSGVKEFCEFLRTSADSVHIPAHKMVADEILQAIDNAPVHIATADLTVITKRGATANSRDLTPELTRKRYCATDDVERDSAFPQTAGTSTVFETEAPDTLQDANGKWIELARQMRVEEQHTPHLAIEWPAAVGKVASSVELRGGMHRCVVSEMRKLRVSSAENALAMAQKLMNYTGKELKRDLKMAAVQAVLPSSNTAIPLFLELLQWCKRADCINPLTHACRVQYRLVWCYHRAKNMEKAMEHALETRRLAVLVSDDFGSAQADSYYARLEYRRVKDNLSEEKILELEDCHDRVLQKVAKLERWMRPILVRAMLEVAMHKAVSSEFYHKHDQTSAVRLQLTAAQRILDNIQEEFGGMLENADLAYFYQISCLVKKFSGQLERAKELGECSVAYHQKCGRHTDAAEVQLLVKQIDADITKLKEC